MGINLRSLLTGSDPGALRIISAARLIFSGLFELLDVLDGRRDGYIGRPPATTGAPPPPDGSAGDAAPIAPQVRPGSTPPTPLPGIGRAVDL